MLYFQDVWIGYLCEQLVRQAAQLSKIRCPGCSDRLHSPILHLHEQHSLLQKIQLYFEEVRAGVLPTLPQLYKEMAANLPHSDDPTKDEECYISCGRQFLITLTSDALYYGRYISEFTDDIIDASLRPKPKKRKQVDTLVVKPTRKRPLKSLQKAASVPSTSTVPLLDLASLLQ